MITTSNLNDDRLIRFLINLFKFRKKTYPVIYLPTKYKTSEIPHKYLMHYEK